MLRWSVVVGLVLIGWAGLAAQPDATAIVITGARVFDAATGRTSAPASVVIEAGRISAVQTGPGALPAATVIDAAGLTLLPGLTDLVVDAAPSAWVDPDYYYALGLAHGVTAYRLVDAPLGWAVDEKRRAARLDLLAPRLSIAGPGLELRRGPDPEGSTDATPLDGRVRVGDGPGLEREIARAAGRKADWVHLGPTVGPEHVRLAVAAARRARLRVSAEPGEAGLVELARAGVHAIIGLGAPGAAPETSDGRSLARVAAETHTVLVPLLRQSADWALGSSNPLIARELEVLPRRFRDDVSKRLGRRGDRGAERAWRSRRDLVRTFVAAGGRVATGSGAGALGWPIPGLAALHEVQLLADAGISPLDAIRAATVHASAALGAGDRDAARIRVGAAADLVGVEGDPSKEIRSLTRVRLVIRGGEVIDREGLLKQAGRAASRLR